MCVARVALGACCCTDTRPFVDYPLFILKLREFKAAMQRTGLTVREVVPYSAEARGLTGEARARRLHLPALLR